MLGVLMRKAAAEASSAWINKLSLGKIRPAVTTQKACSALAEEGAKTSDSEILAPASPAISM